MIAFYNERDPYAAAWLRNLIDAGKLVPEGWVAVPRDRLARIRTSMGLLQQNSEGCAVSHYGDTPRGNGLPGWLHDTRADFDDLTAMLTAAKETNDAA